MMPAVRHFTPDYAEHATLRDGGTVLLRLLRPDDKELLRRGFERWSVESRYTRFLVPKQHLSDDELDYLCNIDQEKHFALGAVSEAHEGPPVGKGIARFVRLADTPEVAEAAISVADDARGRGLGQLLLLRLCAAARERGVERFCCMVLCDNKAMQQLIAHIAPTHSVSIEQGVATIVFDIPAVAPDDALPESSLYRFFRSFAKS